MKKISICVPCFNEEENIINMYDAICKEVENIGGYEFEFVFADNASKDNSKQLLIGLAHKDKRVKVIINNRNFGPARSGLNMLNRTSGDAVVSIPCDFQEPPEMIHTFIKEWESGNLVVWGQKAASGERKSMFKLRTLYYNIIKNLSETPIIKHVTGFGIIDRSVLDNVRKYQDLNRGIKVQIVEMGYPIKLISYNQNARVNGKSSYSLLRYCDLAINTLCNLSSKPLRIISITSLIFLLVMVGMDIILMVTFLSNIINISMVEFLVICILNLICLLFFCIGIIGEYINQILQRSIKRPLVVEDTLVNFDQAKVVAETKE